MLQGKPLGYILLMEPSRSKGGNERHIFIRRLDLWCLVEFKRGITETSLCGTASVDVEMWNSEYI